MSKYIYDDRTGQYRGTGGRFVSPAQVANVVAEAIDQLGDRLSQHSDNLVRGKLSVADWQFSIASQLKDVHIQLGLLASGRGTIDKEVEIELSSQFDRLDQFGQAISRGELSVVQIKARARQYANSARVSFFQVESLSKARSGVKTGKRILDNQAKHCSSCLRYAGLGYVALADLISPGIDCECSYGCKCSVIYRYY